MTTPDEDRTKLAYQAIAKLPEEYVIVEPDGQTATDLPRTLGQGGSSVVFRARHRDQFDRAVKLIIPRNDLIESLGSGPFADSFHNEVTALAELVHQHIAKITDVGTVSIGTTPYPYFVMEFVEGLPLREFAEDPETTGDHLFQALDQVLSALIFIHGRMVMHCDLKEDNILVSRQPGPDGEQISAVLVDLGVSRRILPPDDHTTDAEYTYFFSTPGYVHSRLQAYLANHSGNRITQAELRNYFPWQDLHSFGVILEHLTAEPASARKMIAHVGRRNRKVLPYLVSRLHNPRLGQGYFDSAADVRDALRRTPDGAISGFGIPELSLSPTRGIVLPTSQMRTAGSSRVDSFTSHPLFQRLHQLPQLDLLQHVLPGGTQSRFAHAVHAYNLACTAITQQLGDWQFRLASDRAAIEGCMFSALLDSVGRYHFQHMFEDFLVDRDQAGLRGAGLKTDNEVLDLILHNDGSDLGAAFADIRDPRGRTLQDLFTRNTALEWPEVRARHQDPASPVESLLAALLSGPVDVDKLAYLIDDSAYSGLPFGKSISPPAIFEAMRLVGSTEWRSMAGPRVVAGVSEWALSYVENAVLARYWNIQAGYWHRTNRSLQAMVKYPIAQLLKSQRLNFEEFVIETAHSSIDGALRWLDRRFRQAITDGAVDGDCVNPLAGLLKSQREIYRRLVTISPRSQLESRERDRYIYEELQRRSALADDEVHLMVAEVLKSVDPSLEVKPGEILLDLPRARREESGGKMFVYADEPGAARLGELFTVSPLLSRLQESFDLYAKRLRIFVHPRIEHALGDRFETAHEAVLGRLRDDFVRGRV